MPGEPLVSSDGRPIVDAVGLPYVYQTGACTCCDSQIPCGCMASKRGVISMAGLQTANGGSGTLCGCLVYKDEIWSLLGASPPFVIQPNATVPGGCIGASGPIGSYRSRWDETGVPPCGHTFSDWQYTEFGIFVFTQPSPSGQWYLVMIGKNTNNVLVFEGWVEIPGPTQVDCSASYVFTNNLSPCGGAGQLICPKQTGRIAAPPFDPTASMLCAIGTVIHGGTGVLVFVDP